MRFKNFLVFILIAFPLVLFGGFILSDSFWAMAYGYWAFSASFKTADLFFPCKGLWQ